MIVIRDRDTRGRTQMAAALIDIEGPTTFKRLSDRLARMHRFQRTSKRMSRTVWSATNGLREHVATPDGHMVFWPDGAPPERFSCYRGSTINGESRERREVPYPEKLWLVREVLGQGSSDVARSVAEEIGFSRVTTQFRAEITQLLSELGHS